MIVIVRFVNAAGNIEEHVPCFLDANRRTCKNLHDALKAELDAHAFYFAECEGYDNGVNIIGNNSLYNQGY